MKIINMIGNEKRSYIKVRKGFFALYLTNRYIGHTDFINVAKEWIK